jgi:hypothetical protein
LASVELDKRQRSSNHRIPGTLGPRAPRQLHGLAYGRGIDTPHRNDHEPRAGEPGADGELRAVLRELVQLADRVAQRVVVGADTSRPCLDGVDALLQSRHRWLAEHSVAHDDPDGQREEHRDEGDEVEPKVDHGYLVIESHRSSIVTRNPSIKVWIGCETMTTVMITASADATRNMMSRRRTRPS